FHRRGGVLRVLARPQGRAARPRRSAALRMTPPRVPLRWLLAGGAGGLVVLLAVLGFHRGEVVEYITARVLQGEIRDAVEATGTVNAVITVQVDRKSTRLNSSHT